MVGDYFTHQQVLSKRYTRYGGDFESSLYLMVSSGTINITYLMWVGDEVKIKSVTTCSHYGRWLFDNACDLLHLIEDGCPYEFYNDRIGQDGRLEEFKRLLNSL